MGTKMKKEQLEELVRIAYTSKNVRTPIKKVTKNPIEVLGREDAEEFIKRVAEKDFGRALWIVTEYPDKGMQRVVLNTCLKSFHFHDELIPYYFLAQNVGELETAKKLKDIALKSHPDFMYKAGIEHNDLELVALARQKVIKREIEDFPDSKRRETNFSDSIIYLLKDCKDEKLAEGVIKGYLKLGIKRFRKANAITQGRIFNRLYHLTEYSKDKKIVEKVRQFLANFPLNAVEVAYLFNDQELGKRHLSDYFAEWSKNSDKTTELNYACITKFGSQEQAEKVRRYFVRADPVSARDFGYRERDKQLVMLGNKEIEATKEREKSELINKVGKQYASLFEEGGERK